MFADKALRCDCGYPVIAPDEAGLVEEIRVHAQEAHGIVFSVEDALVACSGRSSTCLGRQRTGACATGVRPREVLHEEGPFSTNVLQLPKGESR